MTDFGTPVDTVSVSQKRRRFARRWTPMASGTLHYQKRNQFVLEVRSRKVDPIS